MQLRTNSDLHHSLVEISEETLYGELAAQRHDQQPIVQVFSFEAGFGAKGADNMWLGEVQQFIAGTRSVEEFVTRMNSRLIQ